MSNYYRNMIFIFLVSHCLISVAVGTCGFVEWQENSCTLERRCNLYLLENFTFDTNIPGKLKVNVTDNYRINIKNTGNPDYDPAEYFTVQYTEDFISIRVNKSLEDLLDQVDGTSCIFRAILTCDDSTYDDYIYTDQEDAPTAEEVEVQLEVKDINNRDPSFETANYTYNVEENFPLGLDFTAIHGETIKASDLDRVESVLTFSINNNDYFDIKTVEAENSTYVAQIMLKKKLDFETEKSVTTLINVRDEGERSGSAHLTVNVINEIDGRPQFKYHLYSCDTKHQEEMKDLHIIPEQITATDQEEEELEFTVSEPENGSQILQHFDFNKSSGTLQIKTDHASKLVGEPQTAITLKVVRVKYQESYDTATLMLTFEPKITTTTPHSNPTMDPDAYEKLQKEKDTATNAAIAVGVILILVIAAVAGGGYYYKYRKSRVTM